LRLEASRPAQQAIGKQSGSDWPIAIRKPEKFPSKCRDSLPSCELVRSVLNRFRLQSSVRPADFPPNGPSPASGRAAFAIARPCATGVLARIGLARIEIHLWGMAGSLGAAYRLPSDIQDASPSSQSRKGAKSHLAPARLWRDVALIQRCKPGFLDQPPFA
jgi:hypothetical protein